MSDTVQRCRNRLAVRDEWPYLLPVAMAALIPLALLASVAYGKLTHKNTASANERAAVTLPADMDVALNSTRVGRGWLVAKATTLLGGAGLLLWALSRALRRKGVLPEMPLLPVRWAWWDIGALVSVYIVLAFAGSALAGSALGSPAGALAEALARAGLIALTLGVVLRIRKGTASSLGLRLDNWRYALGAGVLGFVALQPIQAIVWILQKRLTDGLGLEFELQPSVEAFVTGDGLVAATIMVMAVAVAPLTEEFVFRGMFQGLARKHFGTTATIAASAVLFALAHGNARAFPGLVVVGIGTAIVYDRTRSLIAPIVFHVLHNGLELTGLLALRASMNG